MLMNQAPAGPVGLVLLLLFALPTFPPCSLGGAAAEPAAYFWPLFLENTIMELEEWSSPTGLHLRGREAI